MLKAIFFDIDDTLYSTTEFAALARRAAVEALREHGVRMEPDDLYRELVEVITEFSSNYEHHFDKLLLRLPRESWDGINPAVLVAAAVAAYHDAKSPHLQPFPDVPPVLSRLAPTPLILGVITAGLPVKQAEKLLRLGVYPHLTPTAIFISDQIGISKPNPKLFLRACTETGVAPAEAMYVGDHAAHDIDPANEVGMVSVHVKRGGKYAAVQGKTPPRHTIRDFRELLTLLAGDYRVDLPSK